MRNAFWFFGAVVLCACGPSGTLNGKVEVQGGSAANVAVIAYGPVSAAAVTGDDGAFSFTSLPDGKYVVRATVSDVDPGTQSGSATLTGGKQDAEILLTFKAANAKVTGKVRFTDASSAEALTVTAVGSETRSARTSADGTFTFDGLKTGAYVLTVEVVGTKEGRASIGVSAVGTVDAGELVLTPVGTVTGTVTYNAMPAAGVSVTVPGTSIGTVTDSAGAFTLNDVPGGMQNFRAQSGIEPFFRSGTAMLIVKRGENDPVALTLNDDAPKTGTVTGIVSFRGGRSPRDITVSVRGTSVTASPGPNGLFTIAAPIGEWDIVASAPQHATMVLGRVLVSEGSTQSLPGQELSWYRTIWSSPSQISDVTVTASSGATNPWSIGSLDDGVGTRLFVVNSQTGEFRFVFAGLATQFSMSANGKYAAWVAGSNTVFTYEVATGAMNRFMKPANVDSFAFSSAESVLFIVRTGKTLTRIPLATPTMETVFPSSGTATAIYSQNTDRYFVQVGGGSFDLVGTSSAGDVSPIFTNVFNLVLNPTAYALTDCSAMSTNCSLRVLSPTSITPARDMSVLTSLVGFSPFATSTLRSTAEYPCFNASGTAFCVKASDGTHYPLPGVPTRFFPNADGTRVLSVYNVAGTYSVREEAMPPSPTTAALHSSTDAYSIDWLSNDRAWAFRSNGTTRELRLIKAGAVTATDADFTSGFYPNGSLIVGQRASTSKWSVLLGDGPFRDVDTTSGSFVGYAVRPYSLAAGWPRQALVSFDTTSFTVIDEAAGMLKNVTGAFTYIAVGKTSNSEVFAIGRTDGTNAFYSHATGGTLEFRDGVATPLAYVGTNTGNFGMLSQSSDSRSLLLGSFVP